MSFLLAGNTLFFQDNKPGQHATLFAPSGRLAFREDLSVFDDGARKYAWAFEIGDVFDGDRFIFATADRASGGVFRDGKIADLAVLPGDLVRRPSDNKPLYVVWSMAGNAA